LPKSHHFIWNEWRAFNTPEKKRDWDKRENDWDDEHCLEKKQYESVYNVIINRKYISKASVNGIIDVKNYS
jgi:hypothetical protein